MGKRTGRKSVWQEGAGEATPRAGSGPFFSHHALQPEGLCSSCILKFCPHPDMPKHYGEHIMFSLIKATYSQCVKYNSNLIQRKGMHMCASMETDLVENTKVWWWCLGAGGGGAGRVPDISLCLQNGQFFPGPSNSQPDGSQSGVSASAGTFEKPSAVLCTVLHCSVRFLVLSFCLLSILPC